MAAEKIGPARCPLCGGTAHVSLSKSQLTVMTMNCCNAQLFTRSDKSDSLVRDLLLKREAAPAPAPAAAPVVQPIPVQQPQPAPKAPEAAKPVRTGVRLGFF